MRYLIALAWFFYSTYVFLAELRLAGDISNYTHSLGTWVLCILFFVLGNYLFPPSFDRFK